MESDGERDNGYGHYNKKLILPGIFILIPWNRSSNGFQNRCCWIAWFLRTAGDTFLALTGRCGSGRCRCIGGKTGFWTVCTVHPEHKLANGTWRLLLGDFKVPFRDQLIRNHVPDRQIGGSVAVSCWTNTVLFRE
ncbi:hypothetical protein pipiens_005942 [Culex pipiens pipiens]|uniref:Uncharacterized protein n=1 Tax=Culex pipiens pipiens TaxID=38569 RepID=A0ABD1DSK6_CULPP